MNVVPALPRDRALSTASQSASLVERTEAGKNSLVSIDLARAFAALSVFVYHYGIGHVLAQMTGLRVLEGIAWPGAVFAVPLFFALSGFCIHGAEWHRFRKTGSLRVKEYFIRRARRIYPVYLVAIGISVAVNLLGGKRDSGLDVLVHALLLQGFSSTYFNTINLVLWTISIECCFYVIYPMWLMLRVRKGLVIAVGVGCVVTLVSWLVTAKWLYPYSLPAQWFFLNTWIGWLGGAVLTEKIETSVAWFSGRMWWIAGIVIWSAVITANALSAFDGHLLLLWKPFLILISLWPLSAIVLCERWLRSQGRIGEGLIMLFAAIGLSSYSLYLLHEPLIDLRNILQLAVSAGFLRQSFQAIWFIVVLMACWLSYREVELRFMKKPRQVPLIDTVPRRDL